MCGNLGVATSASSTGEGPASPFHPPGRAEGGCTDAFGIICCDCGDRPDLDCRKVSPELQRIRGPYPLAAGIAVFAKHDEYHDRAEETDETA